MTNGRQANPIAPPTKLATPCRNWVGVLSADGYGRRRGTMRVGDEALAHRWVWSEVNGVIPKGKVVMHLCDNRACFRYDHLTLGTPGDNVRDMHAKGRAVTLQGERSLLAKLTWVEVDEIREALMKGDRLQGSIAKQFNVSEATISNIKSKKIWKLEHRSQETPS